MIAKFPHLPAVIDGSQMQDAVPTLAVLAAFNETPVRFTGIANLRVKECDRVTGAVDRPVARSAPGLGTRRGRRPDRRLRSRRLPARTFRRASTPSPITASP